MGGMSPPHPRIHNKEMVSVSNLNFSLYCDFWKMCFHLSTFYVKKKKWDNWLDLHGSDFDADQLSPLTAPSPSTTLTKKNDLNSSGGILA